MIDPLTTQSPEYSSNFDLPKEPTRENGEGRRSARLWCGVGLLGPIPLDEEENGTQTPFFMCGSPEVWRC